MVSDPGQGLPSEVVHSLGIRVIRGDYPPGSLIEAESLKNELGASATVVQAALQILSARGLTESGPNQGAVVQERAAWHLLDADVMSWRCEAEAPNDALRKDLFELRQIVEPAGARLAAHRRTEDDLRDLGEALAGMTAAERHPDRALAADLRFHVVLLRASHNELLARTDVVITSAPHVRDRLSRQHGQQWRDPVPDHRAIFEAVRDGRGDAARAAMTHLLASSEDLGRPGEDVRPRMPG